MALLCHFGSGPRSTAYPWMERQKRQSRSPGRTLPGGLRVPTARRAHPGAPRPPRSRFWGSGERRGRPVTTGHGHAGRGGRTAGQARSAGGSARGEGGSTARAGPSRSMGPVHWVRVVPEEGMAGNRVCVLSGTVAWTGYCGRALCARRGGDLGGTEAGSLRGPARRPVGEVPRAGRSPEEGRRTRTRKDIRRLWQLLAVRKPCGRWTLGRRPGVWSRRLGGPSHPGTGRSRRGGAGLVDGSVRPVAAPGSPHRGGQGGRTGHWSGTMFTARRTLLVPTFRWCGIQSPPS